MAVRRWVAANLVLGLLILLGLRLL
jgi:hypothetical protein